MKFTTAITALFAMFVVSAYALPHGGGDHYGRNPDYYRGGDSDDIDVEGCTDQGDLTGILPGVLQAGILSDNQRKCVQSVKDVDLN